MVQQSEEPLQSLKHAGSAWATVVERAMTNKATTANERGMIHTPGAE
jgi:hypothetical protein